MKEGFWTVVKNTIKKADVILEVLDARMPDLTRIVKLERFASQLNKPVILVINKIDLISKEVIKKIKEAYSGEEFVLVSTKTAQGIPRLFSAIQSNSKKDEPTIAIIGYPNTGKSSLINRLSKGGKARTSPESGFTKGAQIISGKKGFKLFDSPGVVPYADRDELRLGLVAGISPEKLKDPDLVALELIKIFQKNNSEALAKQYQINVEQDPSEVLEEIGEHMNFLLKGGIVDEQRAARQLLHDWHKGKITL